MSTGSLVTAEELERVAPPDKRVELVRGTLVVHEPPGGYHGALAAKLAHRLVGFVGERELGTVFGQDTGFLIARDPDTVRAPDASFVSRDRLSSVPSGYPEVAPDLAIEIASPGDRHAAILAKVADWLEAGSRLVWVLDPDRRQARIYREDGGLALLGPGEELSGEDVLPGLLIPLTEIFD